MLRRSGSLLLLPVLLAACSSDPTVPAASGSSSDDGASTSTSTASIDPDGDPSTSLDSNATTEGNSETDGTTFTDTDADTSTTSPESTTSPGETDTEGTSTDTEGTSTDTGEPPAICGDGIVDATAGEACDDGGESLTCNVDCTLASCGDGITNATAGEACDDGGESLTCNADCTLASCGDGITNATAGEECDGLVPAGESCQTLGYLVGTLACGAGCSYDTSACADPPEVPVLALGFSQVKQFDFTWAAVAEAEHYQLLESAAPGEPYVQLGGDVVGTSAAFEMPLHFRWEASYVLRACNAVGCTDSAAVDVVGSLAEAVGYVKASNAGANDYFGDSVALSGDGNTLAVGAVLESSNATGIGGNQADNSASFSGAVYVFARDGAGAWSQQAYVKASNTGTGDTFGSSVALSGDGSTLAVGASAEDSNATGIGGNQADDTAGGSGAVYVFARDGLGAWSQQAYVKASNTGVEDYFGSSVALSGDGSTLAVGAVYEDSNATGIGGNQADNSASISGAVYVFVRDGAGAWSQQAYVKASNTGVNDSFGSSVALSGDGNTLAVSATGEDSSATGIGGNQADNGTINSGAIYVFERDGVGGWSQQAYVKASNTGPGDAFGWSIALSGDGSTLAAGAIYEDSNATGIGGNQADDSATFSGALYVFERDGAGAWSQQAYVKASNTGASDELGYSVALSGDGNTLAAGAYWEDSNATGIGGNQFDDSASSSGAVYLY